MSGFSTRAIRASAHGPAVRQRATAVPIFQTATFAAADADELAEVLTGAQPGFAYSRVDNPTTAALAAAVAELEGAEAAIAFASGMAAIHAALLSLLSAGDRIVASAAGYGTTRALLEGTFRRLGVDVAFVDVTDDAAVAAALAAGPTRVLYAETIANPTIVVADHARLAELAHANGATYVVDNTFASPAACRPAEWGADLVVESATKYIGGHSDTIVGVVSGREALIAPIRSLAVDTGGTPAPLNAFLALRGLATLGLRVEHQSRTAATLAARFEGASGVRRVLHPSLASHPQHAVAKRLLDVPGAMLALELEGGREAGRAFIDALTVPELTASLGSVHTMVVHPPSTTHRQLDAAALAEAGIAPGLLRVSVGLEDVDDLAADFEAGLAAAGRSSRAAGTTTPPTAVAAAS
ncbi:MAG TPA: aminotransferase class V-fold PLP-dependent enzyme [Candidatus Limnocylindrales bacterium]|nr:aminotransferase class V-fold PLP-dependent enzyme [Candidatus Limnocylindrales bacterium]